MKIPKIIRTERLVLRPYAEDDFEAFFEFMCDTEATRYLRFTPEQKTHEGAKTFFKDVIDSYAGSKPLFVLAITCARAGQYMGSCGLVPLEDGTGVECYYVLLSQFWGRGFASEAAKALFDHAFKELRINRIVALIRQENHNSQRVVERLGMRHNGMVFDRTISENVMLFSIDKNANKKRFRA
jgi:ribosomal-protein-alanine N-acetyltransferase